MSFTDPSARSLLQTLELLAADAGPEGYTLDEIMARLDEEAFGAALFVLALPCCVPFLYVVPQIVSLRSSGLRCRWRGTACSSRAD